MRAIHTIILSISIALLFLACQNEETIKEKIIKKDMSYRLFNENQLKILDKPDGYFKNLKLTYLYDLDTVSRDSFNLIDLDSIYHIFQEVDFEFISKDSINRNVTLNTISINYYNNHTFKPSFLEVSYYSDNLLGLNLGSKEHGNMSCVMYENISGAKLSGFNKSNYKGSFFLGSMTKHDTFSEIRMVLRIDTFFYEQSFLTKDIDDRTNIEKLEK